MKTHTFSMVIKIEKYEQGLSGFTINNINVNIDDFLSPVLSVRIIKKHTKETLNKYSITEKDYYNIGRMLLQLI